MRILFILVINIVIAVSVFSFFLWEEGYKIIGEEVSYRIEAEGDRLILRDPALNPERQAEQIEVMLLLVVIAFVGVLIGFFNPRLAY